jgi:phthalate 4,5-cis-dihydrodiol dehydrogenase
MATRRLRIGIAGLGRAFSIMLPALASEKLEIVAGADPRPEAQARFRADFRANAYATVEAMCADTAVEAVYVSTPHAFHRANVEAAAANGKHVLVEKPMALGLDDCRAMIDAARAAGIVMVVGHSHSFDLPVRRARDIIASGAVGELRMITSAYFTDFLYRPRRREELDTSQGGGVIYNQAPHQVDVARLLGGGLVSSVRASVGAWDPARPTEGAYQALLTFESGATASLTYSGYAHFDGDELVDWITEGGLPKDSARYGATRRALAAGAGSDLVAEEILKNRVNYGGESYAGPQNAAAADTPRFHQHFGFVLASCTGADLRPTAKGVHVYADTERRFEPLPSPKVYRDEVIDELYDAVIHGAPVIHDGEWGLATMEVCLAMLASHRERRDVALNHQIALAGETR